MSLLSLRIANNSLVSASAIPRIDTLLGRHSGKSWDVKTFAMVYMVHILY